MNKKMAGLFFLVIVIGISGCREYEGEPTSEAMDYRTGSEGLVLEFPIDTITRVYENDPDVRMMVEIRNRGAFPQYDQIGQLNGRIWVGGFPRDIIDLRPESDLLDDEALEGKSSYNLEGGYDGIIISGPAYELPQGTPYYPTKLIVTATYNYETIGSAKVCIDPFPRGTTVREKVCDVYDYSSISLGTQGAPIAVTSIEEEATHRNLLFKIYVEDVGDGLLIDENDVAKNPNRGYDWDKLNKVRLVDVTVGNRMMTECRPDVGNYLTLIDGKGYIFCQLNTAGIDSVYTTPLNIKLRYAYANSVSKDIEIFEEVEY
ncbi:hypothetical protein KY361_01305 [Candidatus Woesearchaeota archaeon]|nr:hypothetical protein [Candidatus Woesearchaeota archaeon]